MKVGKKGAPRGKKKGKRVAKRQTPRQILALATKAGTTVYCMSIKRAAEFHCMPPWANQSQILQLYIKAQLMRIKNKQEYQVDHIVPLYHHLVCGLHVPDNLRIITRAENEKKSNNFTVLHQKRPKYKRKS